MEITKQEARELRRETSLLGQQDNLTVQGNYLPEEMGTQQALQEGLSIITNPTSLDFHHTNNIYIKPELVIDEAEFIF